MCQFRNELLLLYATLNIILVIIFRGFVLFARIRKFAKFCKIFLWKSSLQRFVNLCISKACIFANTFYCYFETKQFCWPFHLFDNCFMQSIVTFHVRNFWQNINSIALWTKRMNLLNLSFSLSIFIYHQSRYFLCLVVQKLKI
jgi:hypothetical protein